MLRYYLTAARAPDAMLEAIQNSALSQLLTSERWAITANSKQILETLHFIAFALQIGAVMVVSVRLLGLGRNISIAALSRAAFWTGWLGFAAVFVTGALQLGSASADSVDGTHDRRRVGPGVDRRDRTRPVDGIRTARPARSRARATVVRRLLGQRRARPAELGREILELRQP